MAAEAPENTFLGGRNVAQAVPSVGVPKVGLPKLSMPKLFQNCLPVKLVFFRPCI